MTRAIPIGWPVPRVFLLISDRSVWHMESTLEATGSSGYCKLGRDGWRREKDRGRKFENRNGAVGGGEKIGHI